MPVLSHARNRGREDDPYPVLSAFKSALARSFLVAQGVHAAAATSNIDLLFTAGQRARGDGI